MIQIGRIIHEENLLNHKTLNYLVYQKISDQNNVKIQLPTLIIGWKLVNKIIPNKPHDILEKEVPIHLRDKMYWEFSPLEDIIQYSNGLDFFLKKLPYLFISRFEYKNIDPFFNNLFRIEDINSYVPDGGNLYVYKNESIYYHIDNMIYGLKLSIYDYLGVDTASIIKLLVTKANNHILDDSTEYQKYYKLFPEFGYLKRSMVVFLF